MRTVIKVGEEPKEQTALRPIEFTYYLDTNSGWYKTDENPSSYDKIVYLGKCKTDGDMFACYASGNITIYKGHLNDGVY